MRHMHTDETDVPLGECGAASLGASSATHTHQTSHQPFTPNRRSTGPRHHFLPTMFPPSHRPFTATQFSTHTPAFHCHHSSTSQQLTLEMNALSAVPSASGSNTSTTSTNFSSTLPNSCRPATANGKFRKRGYEEKSRSRSDGRFKLKGCVS